MFRVWFVSALLSLVPVLPSFQNPPPAHPPVRAAPRTPAQIQAEYDADERQRKEITDVLWRKVSVGHMAMEKTSYASRAGGMSIPAFVFTPLTPRGDKAHPAIVWVHPDIYGYMYEYFYPYVREAVSRGYVVIAPEYRGSTGYGRALEDAIDYGGTDVDDVLTAVDYLKKMPIVDPERIGIIGWSRGAMMTLLAATREPRTFKAAAALVPVTNLFQRLAWSGDGYRAAIDPQNRLGGTPAQRHDIYRDRSPVYQIDKLEIPLLVHITRNDDDVRIEEAMQLVDALRARKPELVETKVYDNPIGGHLFDRMCPSRLPVAAGTARPVYDPLDPAVYEPTNTPEQRDSWNRVWTFLDWNLRPYVGAK